MSNQESLESEYLFHPILTPLDIKEDITEDIISKPNKVEEFKGKIKIYETFDKEVYKKFNNLILDELRQRDIQCWIAGGCLRDFFNYKEIENDIDLFFSNETDYFKTLTYLRANSGDIFYESSNSTRILLNNQTFDLVKKFHKNPTECIAKFDFSICMFAFDGSKLYHEKNSFIDLARKRIRIINYSEFKVQTLKRVIKYLKKGFLINNKQLLALAYEIQQTKEEINRYNIEDDDYDF